MATLLKKNTTFKKGHIPWNKGIPMEECMKKRLSDIAKNRIVSEETRRKISIKSKGKKHTKESINKIKEARKKQVFSKEARLKMSLSKIGKTPWNKGIPLSDETKIKLSIANKGKNKGENNVRWIKDRNLIKEKLDKQIRKLEKYILWRKSVYERDGYICQICNVKGTQLNADHIKAFSIILKENNINNTNDALNCNELWNINNGRTLCVNCHKKTNNFGISLVHQLRKCING